MQKSGEGARCWDAGRAAGSSRAATIHTLAMPPLSVLASRQASCKLNETGRDQIVAPLTAREVAAWRTRLAPACHDVETSKPARYALVGHIFFGFRCHGVSFILETAWAAIRFLPGCAGLLSF